MSFVDQLKPDGKEIEIGNKKYTQDTKITFNMKAFISLVIIIGGLFGSTYFLIDSRLSSSEEKHEIQMGDVNTQLDQIKDESLMELKEKVDATNAKMELLMILINSNQININDISAPGSVSSSSPAETMVVDSLAASRLPNLDNLENNN